MRKLLVTLALLAFSGCEDRAESCVIVEAAQYQCTATDAGEQCGYVHPCWRCRENYVVGAECHAVSGRTLACASPEMIAACSTDLDGMPVLPPAP